MKRSFALLTALTLLLGACTTARQSAPVEASGAVHTHENLHSVLWVQTAAEYRAVTLTTYESARRMLDSALAAPDWSALPEADDEAEQPPAVILDVDETVLDNVAYQARLVERDAEYDSATWAEWVREEAAEPVPGAVDFTRYAADLGVAIFYVTNRRAQLEAATRANLERLGFPLDPDTDTVIMRGEEPHPDTGDKTTRRAAVDAEYRVLLMLGDNIGDFLGDVDRPVAERRDMVETYTDYWGTRWFMLPNPQYGSWEGALFDNDHSLSRQQKLERKYEMLDTQD